MNPNETFDRLARRIEQFRDEMVDLQVRLCAIPAIAPSSGGEGEAKKADFLIDFLKVNGFVDVALIKAPDLDTPAGYRPSVLAYYRGKSSARTTWIMTHTDVVPPGELSLWHANPYKAWVEKGRVYGRGVEDNQQDMVASLFAVKALRDERIVPNYDIGIALVADEETGSRKGIDYVIQNHKIFRKQDLIIVPDAGNAAGMMIEVAEKSILWLKFKVEGKQGHASMPHTAKNALEAGVELAYRVNKELKATMTERDELFDPPISTFELTMKVANVANINTIPGEDIFFMDCRVLPERSTDEVLDTVRKVMKQVGDKYGTTIHLSLAQNERAAPRTDPESRVVQLLSEQVRQVLNVEPRVYGIGGGTCAAYFRKKGFDAAVWGKIDEVAHSANEYTWIQNIVDMTKVFALMMLRA